MHSDTHWAVSGISRLPPKLLGFHPMQDKFWTESLILLRSRHTDSPSVRLALIGEKLKWKKFFQDRHSNFSAHGLKYDSITPLTYFCFLSFSLQGCPKLRELTIHLKKLSQLQVYHSTPLLALCRLTLECEKVAHLSRVLNYVSCRIIYFNLIGFI